jgi:hypothetical protein
LALQFGEHLDGFGVLPGAQGLARRVEQLFALGGVHRWIGAHRLYRGEGRLGHR